MHVIDPESIKRCDNRALRLLPHASRSVKVKILLPLVFFVWQGRTSERKAPHSECGISGTGHWTHFQFGTHC